MANEQTEKKMDIELENPADFTSPEELYKDLIRSIRKYHPSDDISLIEKAYKVAHEAHKDQKRNPISFTLFVLPSFWQTLRWIRRPLRQAFFMMSWKTPS